MNNITYIALKDKRGEYLLLQTVDEIGIALTSSARTPYTLGQITTWINYHTQKNTSLSFDKPELEKENLEKLLRELNNEEKTQFYAGTRTLQGPFII